MPKTGQKGAPCLVSSTTRALRTCERACAQNMGTPPAYVLPESSMVDESWMSWNMAMRQCGASCA
eukprot:jgi/Chrpa1/15008/Chrysochromulina_OHIO_Genome00019095-RA